MSDQYEPNSIAVISYGCLLPGGKNPDMYWQSLMKGECVAAPIESSRWNPALAKPDATPQENLSRSAMATQIPGLWVDEIRKKYDLKKTDSRLLCYALEAIHQAAGKIKWPEDRNRVGVVLGFMNPDKVTYTQMVTQEVQFLKKEIFTRFPDLSKSTLQDFEHFTNEQLVNTSYMSNEQPSLDRVVQTQVLNEICRRYELGGPAFYTDAACASSLAAINASMNLLVSGSVDMVFTGGIESNLDLGTYVLFSKLKALAPDICRPFDLKSEGITHGEGAALFAMKRLKDAIRDHDTIYAVIPRVGGSSDGKSASLFQPTAKGQNYAYTAVHGPVAPELDYIEAHATGTQVGDQVEAQSLNQFFGKKKTFVGTAKSIVGHTKGAAGGASLLKCLLMLQNRKIPPTRTIDKDYFEQMNSNLTINRDPVRLSYFKKLKMCISSLGFGGSNFHLIVEEFNKKKNLSEPIDNKEVRTVVIGRSLLKSSEVPHNTEGMQYKIPPNSLSQIDEMQILCVRVVEKILQNKKIRLQNIPTEKISVITAGNTGLDQMDQLVRRIFYHNLVDSKSELYRHDLTPEIREVSDFVQNEIYRKIPEITEDTGPGILNNVLAGRICNAFNLHGMNFSVDADFNSLSATLLLVENYLKMNPDQIFIVCGLIEELDPANVKIRRQGVEAFLLTSEKFAQANGLPIEELLEPVRFFLKEQN